MIRFFRTRRQIDAGVFRAEYWPEMMLVALVAFPGVAMAVHLGVNA